MFGCTSSVFVTESRPNISVYAGDSILCMLEQSMASRSVST